MTLRTKYVNALTFLTEEVMDTMFLNKAITLLMCETNLTNCSEVTNSTGVMTIISSFYSMIMHVLLVIL